MPVHRFRRTASTLVRIAIAFAVAVAFLIAPPATPQAAAAVATRPMVTNTGGVPMYAQPTHLSQELKTLTAEQPVQATYETQGEYVRVTHAGTSGWVSLAWLAEPPRPLFPLVMATSADGYLGPGPGYAHDRWISENSIVYTDGVEVDGYTHITSDPYGMWVPTASVQQPPAPINPPLGQPETRRLYQTNTGGVPVFSSPDAGSQLRGTIQAYATIYADNTILNDFVHVNYGTTGGWIHTHWLSANPTAYGVVYTTTNNVPVYAGSDTGFGLIGLLPASRALQTDYWEVDGMLHISYGDWGGWVPTQWISDFPVGNPTDNRLIFTNTGGVPAYAEPDASSTYLGAYGGGVGLYADFDEVNGFTHVWYGSSGAWIPTQWTNANPYPEMTVHTNTGGVPVYLGPGPGYYQIGTLTAATAVGASLWFQDGYALVTYGSSGGWIDERWLEFPIDYSQARWAITNTGGVPVFYGPGAGYALRTWVGVGTVVIDSQETQDGYTHVELEDGSSGWISLQWLTIPPTPDRLVRAITSGIPMYLGPGWTQIEGSISAGATLYASNQEVNGYIQVAAGTDFGAWVPAQWFVPA